MTPEASCFIEKANTPLARADIMLSVGLNEDAGRTAYLASFHAAQALTFENIGRMHKSHNGVQADFPRLTKNEPRLNAELRTFLSRAYNLKAIADYETGPTAELSATRAAEAVTTGNRFVAHIAGLAASP